LSNLPESYRVKTNTGKGFSAYLLWLIWIVWLPFITPAFVELFQAHPPVPRLVLYLAGIVLFIGIYMLVTLRRARNLVAPAPPSKYSTLATWLPIGIMIVLSLLLTPGYGKDWFDVFIMTSACVAGSLPTRKAALVIAALDLLLVLLPVVRPAHYGLFDLVQLLIFVSVVGAVTIILVWSIITARELRAAREEIARLAISTERLRIARDLHDLLGHNLSLIALKSELAGRLLDISPERAAVEIGDIEQVARTTLQEVREAVAAYRQPTLASELHAAQELLSAAGIAFDYEFDEGIMDTLPPNIEAALAWAIREGVTNVIRHSHARQCTVRARRSAREASVEVIDDGTTLSSSVALQSRNTDSFVRAGGGSGLRGLAERLSALGGKCGAGPLPSGGFRLFASAPLAERKRERASPHVAAPSRSVAAGQKALRDEQMQERGKQQ